jgi:hypothetical protein
MAMQLKIWLGAVLIAAAAAGTYAWSAGSTKVTVLFENDRIKVMRVTKNSPTHTTAESDDHLIVPLTDFTSKETRDGKTELLLRKKGEAYWRAGGSRAYDTTTTADMIVVDLKPGQGTTIK